MTRMVHAAGGHAPIWIAGGGGHAKVVIETARATGRVLPVGVLDDDPSRAGLEVLGVPVRGTLDPTAVARLGVTRMVLAIGDNRAREQLAARLDGLVRWVTLVHPAAVVAASARLGEGTVVFAGAVIQPDAVLGEHVIVNTGASIDHDCVVGAMAHIGPGARLAGTVSVGRGALLGIGSCAIPGCRIGDWVTVGAGGVVVGELPAGVVARGVPARWAGWTIAEGNEGGASRSNGVSSAGSTWPSPSSAWCSAARAWRWSPPPSPSPWGGRSSFGRSGRGCTASRSRS